LIRQTFSGSSRESLERRIFKLRGSRRQRFLKLPKEHTAGTRTAGCTIPQVWADKKPQNVIRVSSPVKDKPTGQYYVPWNRVSTILIFPKCIRAHPSELARESILTKLQGVGGDAIGYSRSYLSVGPAIHSRSLTAFMGDPNRPQSITKGLTMPSWKKASVCAITSMQANGFQLTGAD